MVQQTTPYGDFYQAAAGAYVNAETSTNTDTFTISAWFKLPAGALVNFGYIFTNHDQTCGIATSSPGGGLQGFDFQLSGEVRHYEGTTGNPFFNIADGAWHHIAASGVRTGGAWVVSVIYDGVLATPTSTAGADNNTTVNLATASNSAGGDFAGGGLVKGYIAELWVDRTVAYDFSVAANINKFVQVIATVPEAVPLNTDGSAPTGTSPIIYLRFPVAGPQTNSGTSGAFTNHGATSVASAGPIIYQPDQNAAFSLPVLQLAGAAYRSGSFYSLPLLQLAGVGVTPPSLVGAFTLPLLIANGTVQDHQQGSIGFGTGLFSMLLPGLAATGLSGATGTAAFKLPLFSVLGAIDWTAAFGLPLLRLAGAGTSGGTGVGTFNLPMFKLGVLAAPINLNIAGSLRLPLIGMNGLGLTGATGAGALGLPLLQLLSAGISGSTGLGAFSLPLLKFISGIGYTKTADTVTLLFPLLQISATGLATPSNNFRGWALNSSKGFLTEYTNLPFNSLALIGNTVYAASASGIYVMDPAAQTDAGANIDAYAESGLDNFDDTRFKRIPRAYVTSSISAAMEFHVLTKMTGTHKYVLPFNGNSGVFQRRVKIGRNVREVWFGHAFRNQNGGDFSIDKVALLPTIDPRRVY